MREFIADYYSMPQDIEQFRIYRCQVNEFIGQLEKINSQDMIIGITREFISEQKIIASDTTDKYFVNELNSG